MRKSKGRNRGPVVRLVNRKKLVNHLNSDTPQTCIEQMEWLCFYVSLKSLKMVWKVFRRIITVWCVGKVNYLVKSRPHLNLTEIRVIPRVYARRAMCSTPSVPINKTNFSTVSFGVVGGMSNSSSPVPVSLNLFEELPALSNLGPHTIHSTYSNLKKYLNSRESFFLL